jgi:hypothetical protein
MPTSPAPVLSCVPFTLEMHDDAARHQRYKQSRLSLTPLGEANLAGTDDSAGITRSTAGGAASNLTNDHLWRRMRPTGF